MLVVNLYGSPGTGKSTLAAELFVAFKKQGYKTELVSEYAKDCVYEKKLSVLADQLYLLAKMNHKLFSLKESNIDIAICDSPFLLNIIYYHKYRKDWNLPENIMNQFIIALNSIYNRFNVLIERDKSIQYQHSGRLESEEDSLKIQNEIIDVLQKSEEKYMSYINSRNTNNINNLIEQIKGKIKLK